jgi:hypothetical protein
MNQLHPVPQPEMPPSPPKVKQVNEPSCCEFLMFFGGAFALCAGLIAITYVPGLLYGIPVVYRTLYGRELYVITACRWSMGPQVPCKDLYGWCEWRPCKELCDTKNTTNSLIGRYGNFQHADLSDEYRIKQLRKQYHFHSTRHVRNTCGEVLNHFEKEARLKVYEMPEFWNWWVAPQVVDLTFVKKNGECTTALQGSNYNMYTVDDFKVRKIHKTSEIVFRLRYTDEEEFEDCPDLVREVRGLFN